MLLGCYLGFFVNVADKCLFLLVVMVVCYLDATCMPLAFFVNISYKMLMFIIFTAFVLPLWETGGSCREKIVLDISHFGD